MFITAITRPISHLAPEVVFREDNIKLSRTIFSVTGVSHLV
jgi:hypothetical protein